MRRWQVFCELCGHLRAGMLGGRGSFYPFRASWKDLFEIARAHVIVPSLSWCLRDEMSVAPEFRSYLDAVIRLNGKRNERLCRQLEEAVGALNTIDIEPTLLKGAAHLLGGIYPTSAARLMSDLDLLVPQERSADAFAAMQRIGFGVDTPIADRHHHLPAMRHSETDVVIELHTPLIQCNLGLIVPVAWVHQQSRPIPFRGLRVRISSPTVLIGHNIVHDQLNHQRYAWKQIELRQLLDFAMIRAHYEQEIDWEELDGRFNSAGLATCSSCILRYDKVLFRQPMPAITSAPRAQAIRRLRRAMEFPLTGHRLREAEQEARRKAEQQARQANRQARRNWHARWVRKINMIVTLPMYYISERRRDPKRASPRARPANVGATATVDCAKSERICGSASLRVGQGDSALESLPQGPYRAELHQRAEVQATKRPPCRCSVMRKRYQHRERRRDKDVNRNDRDNQQHIG